MTPNVRTWLLCLCSTAWLTACGGGGGDEAEPAPQAVAAPAGSCTVPTDVHEPLRTVSRYAEVAKAVGCEGTLDPRSTATDRIYTWGPAPEAKGARLKAIFVDDRMTLFELTALQNGAMSSCAPTAEAVERLVSGMSIKEAGAVIGCPGIARTRSLATGGVFVEEREWVGARGFPWLMLRFDEGAYTRESSEGLF